MKQPIVVLSVFDGMSCGRIALKELGYNVKQYYASEIDKFAIQQTQHNFPNTIQLGDVTKIKAKDLPKIDLFIGGSPCQGFSFAGKQLNFDDPRSALFFEFVRIWKEVKEISPKAKFLLENVNMKKEYLRVISEQMGVFPVRINSNLVSAQNRDRWYWTNIQTKEVGLFGEIHSDIPQPEGQGILLKDILEEDVDSKYFLSQAATDGLLKHKARSDTNGWGFGAKLHTDNDKFNALKVGGSGKDDIYCVSMVGRRINEHGVRKDYDKSIPAVQRLEANTDGKTNCLSTIQKDNLIMQINPSKESGGRQPYQHNRVYDTDGIIPALCVDSRSPIIPLHVPEATTDYKLRRLTPTECARLQTIPPWYEWVVSDTQIYKMLGNGWTVEVIKHIFSFLDEERHAAKREESLIES